MTILKVVRQEKIVQNERNREFPIWCRNTIELLNFEIVSFSDECRFRKHHKWINVSPYLVKVHLGQAFVGPPWALWRCAKSNSLVGEEPSLLGPK